MIYIFDIDGTVADLTHRLHFIGATYTKFVSYKEVAPKQWEDFHAACTLDSPIWPVITVARALENTGHTIIYSTGRSDNTRLQTREWLRKYRCPGGPIYMRTKEDNREDYVVKGELLNQILQDYNTTEAALGGVFEDRQQVVDMLRERGVKVFQVAPGKF